MSSNMWPKVAGGLTALLLLGMTSACGDHPTDAPQRVAAALAEALTADDGRRACGLLAPETLLSLEQSSGKPCPQAVVEEDLPEAGGLTRSDSFGTMAQVEFTGDVMFVTKFSRGWKVLAAGCSPPDEPNEPFDCLLKGG